MPAAARSTINPAWREFGALFKALREEHKMSQSDVAREFESSVSGVAMMEQGRRPPLSRENLIRFIRINRIWPPMSDDLLSRAGHNADRSEDEEIHIQRNFPFSELYIFARHILEPKGRWYDAVLYNLTERHIRYFYITSEPGPFFQLRDKLKGDSALEAHMIDTQLECVVLPEQFFVSNFALYKYADGVYCCGTKRDGEGRAISFYTAEALDAERLYQQVKHWVDDVHRGKPIRLGTAKRVHPSQSESVFIS